MATTKQPWQGNQWAEKNKAEVHITKLKCVTPSDTERTGVQKKIKVWFVIDKGRSKGAELDTVIPLQEAFQAFKFWCNVEQLEVDAEYIFDVDERPFSVVTWRSSKWIISDIQTDFAYRTKIIHDMMTNAGLSLEHHIYENRQLSDLREKVRQFDTTVQAKQWAEKYIQEHSNPMTDIPNTVLDDLKTQGNELDETLNREPHWIDDAKERAKFWGDVNKCGEQYEAWKAMIPGERGNFVHDAIGSTVHETEFTRPEATKLVISAINAKWGKQDGATPKHWADDPAKLEVVVNTLEPHAKRLEIHREFIISEACHVLKIDRPQQSELSGKAFCEEVINVWKFENLLNKRTNEKATNLNETPASQTSTPENSVPPKIDAQSTLAIAIPTETPKSGITTIKGIDILDIPAVLNQRLPPEAYEPIGQGIMSGKTDVDADYIRKRLDDVFGGLCWRIAPNPVGGCVLETTEQRTNNKTWHICKLIAHTFQYAARMPDGSIQWIDASTTSDQHDNMDEQYAKRGAMTAIMKQFYKMLGGMDHIVFNEYTHIHAQKEIAARNKRKTA